MTRTVDDLTGGTFEVEAEPPIPATAETFSSTTCGRCKQPFANLHAVAGSAG